jgi:hypothetical protein
MNFTVQQIASLRKASQLIDVFREIEKEMSAIGMQTILEVAARGDKGTTVKYLEAALNVSGAAASRQLQKLEPPTPAAKTNRLDLAVPAYDPMDAKSKLRVPTAKMEAVVVRIARVIEG